MMNWDDLRFFLAVARSRSIRGAARTLRVNHSTVTRRVTSLESHLGSRLFDRLSTGYLLTSAGERLLVSAERIEAESHSIMRAVVGQDGALRGPLRVTMPDSIALRLLMPDLATFAEQHPEIDIELDLSYSILNLSTRQADVAIRLSSSPSDHLVGRRLVTMGRAVYASPSYLNSRGWPENTSRLEWIGWAQNTAPAWVADSPFPTARVRHRIDHSVAQLHAAKAGLGMTMLPCFIGDPEPALTRVSEQVLPGRDIWVLTHQDLRRTARVQAFTRHIATAISRQSALIRGDAG